LPAFCAGLRIQETRHEQPPARRRYGALLCTLCSPALAEEALVLPDQVVSAHEALLSQGLEQDTLSSTGSRLGLDLRSTPASVRRPHHR
jgi:iron complex outermembrane receptor protein